MRVLEGLVSARLYILVTVRRCAIIGNKHAFELMSSGVVKRSIDEASLYPDGNEFKKYQQSKSPVNFADEPSNNTTAVNKISVDLCGCCNQPCDGAWCKRSSLTM